MRRRRYWLLALGLVALVVLGAVYGARAQPIPCFPQEAILKLFARNGETPRVLAMMSGGQAMTIVVSPEGEWKVLALTPDRLACILLMGSDWEALPVQLPGVDG